MRTWDAGTYDRVSGPPEWAALVLDRPPLEGHETVLDAGCGSGRVTRMLLERLPDGHVVAVDSARSLFERMFAALRPGGVLVAQCGRAGNIARFHARDSSPTWSSASRTTRCSTTCG